MKEFMARTKPYRDFLLFIVVLASIGLGVLKYFATNEALTLAETSLNTRIEDRHCRLSDRITITQAGVEIAHLERERLEKTRLKIDLTSQTQTGLSPTDNFYRKEQLDQISKDFQRIDDELKGQRSTLKASRDRVDNAACEKDRK